MRINILTVAAIVGASFARGQFGPIPPQPNMPFSADQILTQVLILPDGRHVAQPDQPSKLYRDSLGRSRLEMYFAPVSAAQRAQPVLMNITIFDPIQGARYLLTPGKKKVQKFPLPKLSEMPKPPDLAELLANMPTDFAAASAAGADDAKSPPSDNEALGRQTIEGVTAIGRRTTMRYAPGTYGSKLEVVTTFEAWESPELGMMMVLTKSTDTRSGKLTTRMTNISRREPDPALFQVPADYTIEEQPIQGAKPSGQNK